MQSKRVFLNNLKEEIELLQLRINNHKKYIAKLRIKRVFYNCCIYLDRILPFFIAGVICVNLNCFRKNSPFRIDEIKDYGSIEELHDSNGHIETTKSYDIDYTSKVFEYCTGWYVNEQGLYEKVTTYYRYNEIKGLDVNDILQMTPEKISQLFTIIDINRVQKSSLDNEERQEQAAIRISVPVTNENFITREETFWENSLVFLGYLCCEIFLGTGFFIIEKKAFRNIIQQFLKEKIVRCQVMNTTDIAKLKEVLEIKIKNYHLLTNEEEPTKTLQRGLK